MRFLSKTKYFVVLSCVIILAGLIAGIINGGLNLGIDFTGGNLLTVNFGQAYEQQTIDNALRENGIDPATTQIVSVGDSHTEAIIRMQLSSGNKDQSGIRDKLIASLQKTYPNAKAGEMETVGGVTTGEIIRNAFFAVIIASALMLVYIWIRFALFSGIAAVIALIHDVLVMLAFVSLARVQINSSFIAACLTIVGYSINDTIVVFDRIRENNRILGNKEMTRMEVADLSIRETLPRTINTSLTTLITITAVYIFGVASIREFALPLIVGLISGTYSSIFIASPIWIALEDIKNKNGEKKPALQKQKA